MERCLLFYELNDKTRRKNRRFTTRLNYSKGINCTSEPYPCIILCNVGQATGLEKETILGILENMGGIKLKRFIAEKGESYSFLEFNNKEDAKLFFNAWNGKVMTGVSKTPIYMSYLEDAPDTEKFYSDPNPDGLILFEDFITDEEEKFFIELFDWEAEPNLKHRSVKHYGYRFRYGSNDVDMNAPLEARIPDECQMLWERLRMHGVMFETPDQLTVNKYKPGQGIPSHVDRHSPFGETIFSLSLGSTIVMEWKHYRGSFVPLVVPNRSMLVMQGEARYEWQHSIYPRTCDPVIESIGEPRILKMLLHESVARGIRISLTFRKTRHGPCFCNYRILCDNREKEKGIQENITEELEELHVHQVYEQIAGHFSRTRQRAWPRVQQFVQEAPAGSVMLDLGAGNGKNMMLRTDIVQIACERSSGLLAECQRRVTGAADCVRLDVLRLGLRPACADVVLCVAVIHHLSSAARRKEAVRGIARLLRPDGRALITVWAKDQTKANYLGKARECSTGVVSTVGGLHLPVHENRTQFQHSDLLVPWRLRPGPSDADVPENTLLRYYHVFEEGELEELCRMPGLLVETCYYDEGNWCVICRKI